MPAEPSEHEVKNITLEVVDKPARRNPWRPTLLTIRVFLKICHHIEHGFSVPNACEVEGISYRRFRDRVSQSSRLAERFKKAEMIRFNLRQEEAMASIMSWGEKSWMAHAWWLERCLPHLYALRNVNRADPSNEQPEVEIPAEVLARHRALMLELAREDEAKRASLTQGGSAA